MQRATVSFWPIVVGHRKNVNATYLPTAVFQNSLKRASQVDQKKRLKIFKRFILMQVDFLLHGTVFISYLNQNIA